MSQTDRITGLVGYSGVKVPVLAATTAAITLSGEQTIDGIACVTGDRVLVKNQASGVDNGIYVVDTGDWELAKDADGPYDYVFGTIVPVAGGSTNGGKAYRLTSTGTITPGTTSMTFAEALFTSLTGVTFTQAGTGAVARSAQDKMREWVSVKDFGAVGDGSTDDTTAIAAAIAASRFVWMPPGTYKITSQLSITQNYQSLIGAGVGLVTITMAHASNVAIKVTTSPVGLDVGGFTLDRSIAATAGGTGLDFSAVIGTSKVHDLIVQNQYIGVKLGPTDYSYMSEVIVQKNYNIGISMTNTAGNGTMQWDLRNVLSQMNDSHGIIFSVTAGPAQAIMGQWNNVTTFANTGYGAAIVGSAGVPVHDLRVTDGFFGSDASGGLYLETYGRQHCIRNCFTEIAGTIATGRTLTTAASGVGRGVEITANNVQVQISNHTSSGNSQQGLVSSATNTQINGGTFINNGANGTAGTALGVSIVAGRGTVVGITSGNTGAGTTQKYGVNFSVDAGMIADCDLTNNAIGPIFYGGTFPPVGLIVSNVLPITEITYPLNPVKSNSYIWTRTTTFGIGYATGSGGTVNQGAGSGKATGVALNKLNGTIVTDAANLNAGAEVSFTVANTTVVAGDVIIVNHASGGTGGAYAVEANTIGANTFNITISNLSAGNLAEALTLNFAVIKAVSA